MEQRKSCIDCVWRVGQPNDNKLVMCRFHNIGVYIHGVPCPKFELYDPKNKAF